MIGLDNDLAEIFATEIWANGTEAAALLRMSEREANKRLNVVSWDEERMMRVRTAVQHNPREAHKGIIVVLCGKVRVRLVFLSDPLLGPGGIAYDGLAYERMDTGERWVGLFSQIFDPALREEMLDIPFLDAILVEEMAHAWDYRLEAAGSPHASSGGPWRAIATTAGGAPAPFDVPNRRIYEDWETQIAEDWALAVVWYVFWPAGLEARAPQHAAFMRALFREVL